MVMNPRTHPRGAAPDFTLPKKNPNPARMTDALWWLVCMRLELEPLSENGGTYANKPAYHNAGENLPDHGLGSIKTDASIRRAPDRAGPWWKTKCSAHDWTFTRAHSGNYTEISKYCNRLRNAMRDPKDLRPDNVYAYFIGQIDNDRTVEGYNEYTDDDETGDQTHLWHRHDSFRRNIVGDFWAMWKALTIDMGWTYAEWLRSAQPGGKMALSEDDKKYLDQKYVLTSFATGGGQGSPVGNAVLGHGYPRRPGEDRQPAWQNLQAMQVHLDQIESKIDQLLAAQNQTPSGQV